MILILVHPVCHSRVDTHHEMLQPCLFWLVQCIPESKQCIMAETGKCAISFADFSGPSQAVSRGLYYLDSRALAALLKELHKVGLSNRCVKP